MELCEWVSSGGINSIFNSSMIIDIESMDAL
jgi:hypothetical protein